jgi:hypothetical protein
MAAIQSSFPETLYSGIDPVPGIHLKADLNPNPGLAVSCCWVPQAHTHPSEWRTFLLNAIKAMPAARLGGWRAMALSPVSAFSRQMNGYGQLAITYHQNGLAQASRNAIVRQ